MSGRLLRTFEQELPPPFYPQGETLEVAFFFPADGRPKGRIEVQLSWSSPAQEARLYVTSAGCPGGLGYGRFQNNHCTVVAQAVERRHPQTLSFNSTGARYEFFVANHDPGPMSFKLEIAGP